MFKSLLITTIVMGRMIVIDPVRPEAARWYCRDCGCGGGRGGDNGGGDGGGRDGGGGCGEACQGGWT